ncbi:MAG: DUF285 domain-containing protein, partial [Clostridia bacterium]|nr:DUF285 domain-containing protein [Clostridia bacterium]
GIFAISTTKDRGQTVTAEAATLTSTIYWGVSGTTLYISSSSLPTSYSPSGTHSGGTQAPWATMGNLNTGIRNNITKININKNIVCAGTYAWFNKFPKLTDISTLTKVDVSNCSHINDLFRENTSLTDISAVANWQLTNCTQATWVIATCESLTDISPISNWDTSNFEQINNIFNNCYSLTDISPISGWNTSKVVNMTELFFNCYSLTDVSPISGWDTSKVTTINGIFWGCSSLAAIDISNLNFDSVTNCDSMFKGTTALESVTLSDKQVSLLAASADKGGLFDAPHTKWYDSYGNEYTDASMMTAGGTYTTVCPHKHSWSSSTDGWKVKTPATCSSVGSEERICKNANCPLPNSKETRDIAIDPTAHNFGTTWQSDGTNHWHECTLCGAQDTAIAHTAGAAATCTKAQTCTVCSRVLTAALTHSFDTATWKSDGTNHWHECTRPNCNEKDSEGPHNPDRIAADCENAQVCTTCSYQIAAKLGHSYNDVVTPPTCETGGKTTHTCANCGDTYDDTQVTATGHKWSAPAWQWAANYLTCKAKFTCSNCNKEQLETASVTHNSATASCTVAGDTTYTASVTFNNNTYTDSKVISGQTLPHTWQLLHESVAPDCENDGAGQFECSVCQKQETRAIDKLGHVEVDDAEVLATCTIDGKTAGKHCSRCNKTLAGLTVIPALGHNWTTNWNTDTTNHWHECSVCHEKKDDEAHTYDWVITKAPTEDEEGEKEEYCTVCQYANGNKETLAKLVVDDNGSVSDLPTGH